VPLTPAPGLHPIDGRDSAVLRDLLERHPVVPLLSVRGCGVLWMHAWFYSWLPHVFMFVFLELVECPRLCMLKVPSSSFYSFSSSKPKPQIHHASRLFHVGGRGPSPQQLGGGLLGGGGALMSHSFFAYAMWHDPIAFAQLTVAEVGVHEKELCGRK